MSYGGCRLNTHWPLWSASLGLALISLTTSLLVGSAEIAPAEVWWYVLFDDGSLSDRIIDGLRLPRTLSAFAVGGVLALAGALMQVLLRNPLADPYVLGVSGGAACAVMLGMLLGLSGLWLTPLALGGALLSIVIVFVLGQGAYACTTDRLLLTGIVVAAGWSALISLILSLGPPMRLPGMLFWLMGDLSDALSPAVVWAILGVGLLAALWLAPQLNLAVYGLQQAALLGVNPQRLQRQLYFLASLLTAAAVSIAGAIGFIGLIVPHMVRLAGGRHHGILLPVAVLLGGSLLVLADTLARTVISPMQLPVGVLTAMLGVPVFLWLLHRQVQQ